MRDGGKVKTKIYEDIIVEPAKNGFDHHEPVIELPVKLPPKPKPITTDLDQFELIDDRSKPPKKEAASASVQSTKDQTNEKEQKEKAEKEKKKQEKEEKEKK